jgi:GxxExxY protein
MALLLQDLTAKVIGVYYDVYGELGQGFLESVCQTGMEIALRERGLSVVEHPTLEVNFRGQIIGDFVPDMVVDGCLIVEIKSCRSLQPAHEAQLINYLRVCSDIEVGLLFNFGPKPEYMRRILTNDRKIPARPVHTLTKE